MSLTVPLNAYLRRQVAGLCLDHWRLLRENGDITQVAPLVVDLAAWTPPRHDALADACRATGIDLSGEPLVPLPAGRWASLADA